MEHIDEGISTIVPVGETIAQPTGLKDSVKLVIWDLDETLWSGTLSEGHVVVDSKRSDVVRQLNRRGIISSICSKNDLETARSRLMVEDNLWEEFVFARVAWLPKGPEIVQIIENAQLRPEQVLFIDDNFGNLQEAKYFVPGIQTSSPDIIASLLDLPQLAGRDDPQLKRLGQYKLLEHRAIDREQSEGSNEDFLRSSNIRVVLADNCLDESQFERIGELILRSNQLNYTKRRLESSELRTLLADPKRESRYIQVRDGFGDYGICGFYSLIDGRLTDFLFSCRILNMGVEQWIYGQLGYPSIDVVGEVATPLDRTAVVDWINQTGQDNSGGERDSTMKGVTSKVLLKGACDLVAVNDFLGGSLDTEFNVITAAGLPEHRDHTEILRRSRPEVVAEYGSIIDQLPFLDRSSYDTKVFKSSDYGFLVLSSLTDYTQGIYRLRGTDFLVPFGVYDRDITDPEIWERHPERIAWLRLEPSFLEWFAEKFEFMGPLSIEAFKENIRWLAGAIPRGAHLILVNGPEVPVDIPTEESRHLRHREMNQALDEVVTELSNTAILDVRKFITSQDDLTNALMHYRRRVYLRMAEALRELVDADIQVKRLSKATVRSTVKRFSTSAKRRLPPKVLRTLGDLKESLRRS
jgi:FkbH-like protein